MLVRVLATTSCFVASLCLASCGKADHASLDKWTRTEKGPAKIKKAFLDESLDADLSAHAGANLVKLGKDPEFRVGIEQMTPSRRSAVIAKLTPRLWQMARLEGEMQMPAPPQVVAKDALVALRKLADADVKQLIDGNLLDWYAVASYEGRAQTGAVLGSAVMRAIGPAAAPKLIRVVDGLVTATGKDNKKNRIGDELMLALAATGSSDALKKLLDLAHLKTGDETLPTRALSAAYKAYVDPGGLFDVVGPKPLMPHLDAIVAIARDDSMPNGAANDAVKLVRAVGTPGCISPLISMIGHPHSNPRFKYVAADSALKCGGIAAIKDVARALPSGAYQQDELVGAVVANIGLMKPRALALASVRDLLGEKSWIARWVAVEALAAMNSTEDIPRLAAVSSRERLVGYWGDQSELAAADRKREPTLGERARELAGRLTPLK
jgi:HEAT repeat protein